MHHGLSTRSKPTPVSGECCEVSTVYYKLCLFKIFYVGGKIVCILLFKSTFIFIIKYKTSLPFLRLVSLTNGSISVTLSI